MPRDLPLGNGSLLVNSTAPISFVISTSRILVWRIIPTGMSVVSASESMGGSCGWTTHAGVGNYNISTKRW